MKPRLIALILVFFSCDTAEDVGIKFDLETNVNVRVENFNLPSSNLYIDSLRTDADRIVVGSYSDPATGKVVSEGYFQFRFMGGTLPNDTLNYESINLILKTSSTLPISGSVNIDIEVFEIEDTLNSSLIYLASKEETKTKRLGSLIQAVDLSTDSVFSVRLEDFYGQEIFAVLNEPDSVNTHFFSDLAIASGATNDGLILIDLASGTSKLVVNMTGNIPDTTYTAEFLIGVAGYSHVERDKSSSSFDGITEHEKFDLPDGKTVADPIAGLTTTFNIESLATFFEENPKILINAATITLDAQVNSLRDTLEGFRLYFRKSDGGIFGPAIHQNSFSHIVMTDAGYLSLQSEPTLGVFDSAIEKYSTSPTLFFQSLYTNYQKSKKLIYIEPFQLDTIPVTDLVLISPVGITLQQLFFNNSGINLRVFYTEIN